MVSTMLAKQGALAFSMIRDIVNVFNFLKICSTLLCGSAGARLGGTPVRTPQNCLQFYGVHIHDYTLTERFKDRVGPTLKTKVL